MRLVKLSKEVFGFETAEACIAYFKYVLPWQKYRFNIVGEGSHIAPSKLNEDETVIFSYSGRIIAIAKVEEIIIENQRVVAIIFVENKVKVFDKDISLDDLETKLSRIGYSKAITNAQGWNIFEDKFEKEAIKFLINIEWEDYL